MDTTRGRLVRDTWSESDRFVPRAMVQPLPRPSGHVDRPGLVAVSG